MTDCPLMVMHHLRPGPAWRWGWTVQWMMDCNELKVDSSPIVIPIFNWVIHISLLFPRWHRPYLAMHCHRLPLDMVRTIALPSIIITCYIVKTCMCRWMDAWSSGMATVQIASWCIVEDVFCRPDRMRLSFHYDNVIARLLADLLSPISVHFTLLHPPH